MKYVLALLIVLTIGCKKEAEKDKPCEPEVVAVVTDHTLLPNFADGTKVESQTTVEQDGQLYFVRKGHTRSKDCRISRTPVQQDGNLVMMRMNGTTETCSGKNCSHCSFKTGGGCDCVNSLNLCEHTITKNRDLFRLR